MRTAEEQSTQAGEKVTNLPGKAVYTTDGEYVGEVDDAYLDFTENAISHLALTDVNKSVVDVETSKPGVSLPYRWVASVGEIVLVTTF